MASPLSEHWIYATVPIDNPQGESGTGFLVFRPTEGNQGRVFLVTNKHVIHRDPTKRSQVNKVRCHFNTLDGGKAGTVSGEIPLNEFNGATIARFREHQDPDTDVFAIEVTDVMNLNPKLNKRWVNYDLIADEAKRKALDITMGEDIVTIGYPLGLRQGATNLPLIRQGLIATRIGGEIKDKIMSGRGVIRDRTLRAFLIDGATVPGSSGSPVILKPVIGRFQGGNIQLGSPPPVLLGIVAETKYAPIQSGTTAIPGFAGLGMAFEAETIRETIELFFP